MDENLSFDSSELFTEVADRARGEGITDQAGWDDLVDAVIDEHLSIGEMDKDDDLVNLGEVLKARFADFEAGF